MSATCNPLDRCRQIGELVWWQIASGEFRIGILKDWDSNVAIVENYSTKENKPVKYAVEC